MSEEIKRRVILISKDNFDPELIMQRLKAYGFDTKGATDYDVRMDIDFYTVQSGKFACLEGKTSEKAVFPYEGSAIAAMDVFDLKIRNSNSIDQLDIDWLNGKWFVAENYSFGIISKQLFLFSEIYSLRSREIHKVNLHLEIVFIWKEQSYIVYSLLYFYNSQNRLADSRQLIISTHNSHQTYHVHDR